MYEKVCMCNVGLFAKSARASNHTDLSVFLLKFDQNLGKFTIHILYWYYFKIAENTEIHGKNTENETIYKFTGWRH